MKLSREVFLILIIMLLFPMVSFEARANDIVLRELLTEISVAREQTMHAGSRVWPGFEKAPFLMLLTLQDREVLLCHDKPVSGFSNIVTDPITNCLLQSRPNVFPRNLLAAMPVINGISTIVMGTPKSTNRNVQQWTNTIFHEHFHQYQSTFQDYYVRVKSLGLDGGDVTGMWMLNYDFPYGNKSFSTSFSRAAKALYQAVMSPEAAVQDAVKEYLSLRKKAQQSVSERDWRYLEFQLWAEGVARWTEMETALQSTESALQSEGESLKDKTLKSLLEVNLIAIKREVFYPFGAVEAMLLERCKPGWRRYYSKTLSLGEITNSINPSLCK